MGKAKRVRRFKQEALTTGRTDLRSVARAPRRRGRLPLAKKKGQR